MLQGDLLKPLISLLTQTYGIDPKYVTATSKGKA